MILRNIARSMAPVAAIVLAVTAAGCDVSKANVSGAQGKPLAELDLTGAPPSELALLGPDEVRIRQGQNLAITIDGDKEIADAMRFTLKDGSLAIARKSGTWSDSKTVIVNVTMPAPAKLTAAGSGKIHAEALARKGKIVVTGSGDIDTPNVAAETLEVTIAGSGTYRAAGTTDALEMTIAGSGDAQLNALKAGRARIKIVGSGSSTFASDGEVAANIVGSGQVKVIGRARCTVNTTGSGTLTCEPT